MGYAKGGVPTKSEGTYLRGETDGMADKISTSIDDKQPAALSHGEFVVPADVVSHLGNGNSEAGAQAAGWIVDGQTYGTVNTVSSAGGVTTSTTAAEAGTISQFFSGSWGVPQVAAAIAIAYIACKICPELGETVKEVGDKIGSAGQDVIDGVNDVGNGIADIFGW
jgi:hypothetical protein